MTLASSLGGAALGGGTAVFLTNSLTTGDHSLTAVHGGSANVTVSTSAAVTQTVSATVSAVPCTSVPNLAFSSRCTRHQLNARGVDDSVRTDTI